MDKIWKKLIIPIATIWFSLCFQAFPAQAAAAQNALMTAVEVPSGNTADGLAAAEKKAVMQALARMITPDMNRESVFQQITAQYTHYIIGKGKIVKVQHKGDKDIVFCKVSIDFPKLTEQLNKHIRTLQNSEAHEDDEAFFFVRVSGISDTSLRQTAQAQILNFYADAFQQYGFAKGEADEILTQSLSGYPETSADQYKKAVLQSVKTNVAISLAVVGDIHLHPSLTDATGTNSTCDTDITLVNINADGQETPIGTVKHQYTLRRPTKEEAEKLVLQKAAYNSAKYLSHLTLTFWQHQK